MAHTDRATELERLEQVNLFRGLGATELERIRELGRTRQLEPAAMYFRQGDPADTLYVLLEGQIKLTQLSPDGSQVLVRFVQPGEMFGGVSVFGDATYPVSAESVSDSSALAWDSSTLVSMMEAHPRLAVNAMRHLAGRLQELQQRNLELATERVERRIAHALLRLAQATGRKVEGGVLIDLPLSRQDLAEMTGTTLYTVSRTLSAWQQQGLVEAGRERVLIRNAHGLVSIAEDLPPPSAKR
jgi:CRP-like cAMP-binding protein